MNVDHTLASFSDYAFFSAFIIYSLALVLSVVFYIKRQGLVDLERERQEHEDVASHASAGVGGFGFRPGCR